MASDKSGWMDKMVDLDDADCIKGDPGRNWNIPTQPVLTPPSTDNSAPQPNASTTGSNNTPENKS